MDSWDKGRDGPALGRESFPSDTIRRERIPLRCIDDIEFKIPSFFKPYAKVIISRVSDSIQRISQIPEVLVSRDHGKASTHSSPYAYYTYRTRSKRIFFEKGER
jgi:hypothetical protein